MGKRKRVYTDEEILKKIRRLERRLDRRTEPSDNDEEYDYDYESDMSPNQNMRSVVLTPLDPIDITNIPTSPPNKDTTPCDGIDPVPALSADILEALGVSKNKVEVFAPKIREEISERWGQIIADGFSKEAIQKLLENIHIPENLKLLKAPILNDKMSTILTESTKNRDKRLEKAQNHLGKGIAAIANLTSALIDGELEKTDIIKKLSEAGQLLLDLHCQNTYARRKLITFSLDKKFLSMIQGTKRDCLLFGENLGDKIKANKIAERSGLQIKRTFEPQPSTSSYRSNRLPTRQGNFRGPPRPQVQRGKKGGPRNPETAQTYRRPLHPPVASDRNNASTKTNRPFHRN